MAWYPGNELPYHEFVPGNTVAALAGEYTGYSVPEAKMHPGVFTPTTHADVVSDSLAVYPIMDRVATRYSQYERQVIQVVQRR